MNQLNSILAECRKKYRDFEICVACMILMLAAAAVFVFFNKMVTFIILGIAVVFHLFFLRRKQVELTGYVTEQNILLTVGKKIGAESVEEKSGAGLSQEDIRKAQLLPFDDRRGSCLLREGMKGKAGNLKLPVHMCDAVLAESFQLVKKGKNRVHYTSGTWLEFTLPADRGEDFRILDKDVLPVPIRVKFYEQFTTLKKTEACNEALGDRFILLTRDEEKLPDEEFLKGILSLANYTPGKLAVSMRGDKLVFFLRDRFLGMGVSVKEPPTEKRLEFDPFPEYDRILRMIEKKCDKHK